jgi:hypothetical protein
MTEESKDLAVVEFSISALEMLLARFVQLWNST